MIIVGNNDKKLIGLLQKEQITLVEIEQPSNRKRKVQRKASFWTVKVNMGNLIDTIHAI